MNVFPKPVEDINIKIIKIRIQKEPMIRKHPKIRKKFCRILWHWSQMTNSYKIKLLTRLISVALGRKDVL